MTSTNSDSSMMSYIDLRMERAPSRNTAQINCKKPQTPTVHSKAALGSFTGPLVTGMLRVCTGAKCWRPDLEIAFLQIEKKNIDKWSVYITNISLQHNYPTFSPAFSRN